MASFIGIQGYKLGTIVFILYLAGQSFATEIHLADCGTYALNSTSSFRITGGQTSEATCTWQFLGTPTCYPVISCSDFYLHQSYRCLQREYFTLSDGTNDEGQRYCGEHGPRCSVSQTSILVVTVSSDSATDEAQRRFDCSISCFRNAHQHHGYYGGYFGGYGYNSAGAQSYPGPPSCSSTNQYHSYPTVFWIPSSPPLTEDCDCGLRGPLGNQDEVSNRTRRATSNTEIEGAGDASTLIVGGHDALLGEYRMQATMVYSDDSIRCGATLLNNYYVMTAAHCCVDENNKPLAPHSFDILLNSYDLSNLNRSHTERRRIEEFKPHPLYDPNALDYDVCVCRLEKSVNLQSYSEPILRTTCLPPRRETDQFVGITATVIGWGRLITNGPTPDILQEVELEVISNEQCNREADGLVTDRMMCLEKKGGGQGSCQGDSGGPAFKKLENGNRYEQIGVVSWTFNGCATPGFPSGWARLTELSDWIRMAARDAVWCRQLQPKHLSAGYGSAATQEYATRARANGYSSYVYPRYFYSRLRPWYL